MNDDMDIIKALLNGNHLDQKERQRAKEIIYILKFELKSRYNIPKYK